MESPKYKIGDLVRHINPYKEGSFMDGFVDSVEYNSAHNSYFYGVVVTSTTHALYKVNENIRFTESGILLIKSNKQIKIKTKFNY